MIKILGLRIGAFLCASILFIFSGNSIYSQNFEEIIGGNSPDDFSNFSNSAPNPSFTGDATYSINLGTVVAGGGLDFPLVLTYNTNRLKVGTKSGHVGLGWDLNIGEVVRSYSCLPDEQSSTGWFQNPPSNPNMDLGHNSIGTGLAYTVEDSGILNGGSVLGDFDSFDDWDSYNLSTPYDSKKLIPVLKNGSVSDDFYFLERPYSSWYINEVKSPETGSILSFSMIDDIGRKFLFNQPHYTRLDKDGDGVKTINDYYNNGSGSDPFLFYKFPNSWKLNRIDSPNSDHYVKFEYNQYARVEGGKDPYSLLTDEFNNNLDLCGLSAYDEIAGPSYISFDESVIDKIITKTHIIEFYFIDDNHSPASTVNGGSVRRKILNSIVFKQNNGDTGNEPIVKRIEFNYIDGLSPHHSIAWKGVNLLKSITFKDVNYAGDDHYYSFSYYTDENNDYVLSLYGYLGKYNHLDVISLPTGGEIDFEYEPRKYNYYYEDSYTGGSLRQRFASDNSGIGFLTGERVSSITYDRVDDINSIITKNYSYGDAIRVESRFQDIMDEANFPMDFGYSFAKTLMTHVGHRWLEIRDSEGGFIKEYYTSGISNYNLHPGRCDNVTDCPADISDLEAMGVYYRVNSHHSGGQYLSNSSMIPSTNYLYDTFDEIYGKVYKREIGYYDQSNNRIVKDYSESKWDFVDSEYKYPSFNYSDVLNAQQSIFVYNYHIKNVSDEKETNTYRFNFYRGECNPVYYEHRFREDIFDHLGPPKNEIVVDSNDDSFRATRTYFLPANDGNGNSMCGPAHMINVPVGTVSIRDTYEELGLGGSIYQTLIEQLENPILNGYQDQYPLVSSEYYQNRLDHPIHSGTWTIWNDSDGYFRPREAYVIDEVIHYNGGCHDKLCSNELDQYARKVQTFDLYNTNGDVVETSDINGKKYAYERAADGKIVGVFENTTSDEVFTHSFSYEGLSDWVQNDYNSDGDVEFSISHESLKIKDLPGENDRDNIGYDLGIELSGSIVWEFDVKIPESNNSDFQIHAGGSDWDFFSSNPASETAIWSAIRNETWKVFNASTWVTLKTDLIVGETYNFKVVMHSGTNSADYFLNGEELMSGVSFRFGSTGIQKIAFGLDGNSSGTPEWYVNNVRLYPINAHAVSQELSPNGKPISVKGIDGFTERLDYDGQNRLVAYTNKTGNGVSIYDYNYTTTLDINNNQSYSESTPNNRVTLSSANTGPTDYLASTKGIQKFIDEAHVVNFGDINALDTASELSIALWFNRYQSYEASYDSEVINPHVTNHDVNNVLVAQSSNADNDNFELGTQGPNIELYLDTGSSSQDAMYFFDAGIEDNRWYHLAFTYSASTELAKVYLNGVLVKTWTEWENNLDHSYSSPLTLGMARPNNEKWGVFEGEIAEARVYAYALSVDEIEKMVGSKTVKYFDGIGRPIQDQIVSSNESIISGQLYDGRGLPIAYSRPITVSSTNGFFPNLFGTGFNPGGALPETSPIWQFYDIHVPSGDENYAYSYIEYEDSKTNRTLSTTLPGYDHRFGNSNENNLTYGLNTVLFSTPNNTWEVGSLYKTVSQDPEDKQTISYTNYLGQTVASGVDWDSNGELNGADDLVTTFEYDYNGNLILVEDPRGLLTTYDYNALGELLEKKLPDQDHPNKYCYDDKGRLRFHADPNDFANPYNYNQLHYSYTYTKYDEFDRPVEIGEQDASFVGNNSQASFDIICANSSQINDQNEPSANNNPMIIHSYDGENASSGSRNHKGRLSRTQYKDPNTGSWGYTWYSYNELGLVEMIRQRMPGQNNYNDRTISYTYDELGRLVHVAYDEGYSSTGDHHFWYYYDRFGRLSKITSHQTNSPGSATIEAEYTYFADGQVEQLILGDGVQRIDYDYTVQGWVEEVNPLWGVSFGSDAFAAEYQYDLTGNISVNEWRQKGASNTEMISYGYTYDNANRLITADFNDPTGSLDNNGGLDGSFTYDDNGNIEFIQRKNNNGTYTAKQGHLDLIVSNSKNRITSVLDVDNSNTPYNIIYDSNGNAIKNELQGITDVTYDWRNLPTKVIANGTTINYTYDAEGNRVKKEVVGGETTYYIRGVGGQTFAAYSGGTIKFLNILAGVEIIGQIIKN